MEQSTSQRLLSLAPHVRACESDGQVILLDLRRNRYIGIGDSVAEKLTAAIAGWPQSCSTAACKPAQDSDAVIHRLMAQGLLSASTAAPQPHPSIAEATASVDLGALTGSRIGARRVGSFLTNAAVAALWLRCRSLHAIAGSVAERSRRLDHPQPESLKEIEAAAAVYDWLRPLVFTARDNCLHDSLALVRFLAGEGLRARWVIGVKTCPFGAHSWVQSGHTVLNDQHENVRRFRPILVV
ncbi:lasso peptide biosynthesis B2 protein [Roseateles sp.]|uniref:lasso peptide biosynthesis B2 protein n=1 Tax=Roseateles sp. TaxID=1971397 RepID=UPI0032651E69